MAFEFQYQLDSQSGGSVNTFTAVIKQNEGNTIKYPINCTGYIKYENGVPRVFYVQYEGDKSLNYEITSSSGSLNSKNSIERRGIELVLRGLHDKIKKPTKEETDFIKSHLM